MNIDKGQRQQVKNKLLKIVEILGFVDCDKVVSDWIMSDIDEKGHERMYRLLFLGRKGKKQQTKAVLTRKEVTE